jgi:triosephosphate isomerase (TIM)
MYKLLAEALATALSLKPLVSNATHAEVIIAPAFPHLKTLCDRLEGSNIRIAAQNCSANSSHGAYTGEVAADMLVDVGCTHVIIGHSERRQMYGETNEQINRKIGAALKTALTILVCVGETLAERESGNAQKVVKRQIAQGLDSLTVTDMERIIIAYEPVWAIGTGVTATPNQAQEMHSFIRNCVGEMSGGDIASETRILYGGSVKPDNIGTLMACDDIDGALVGGASLDAESFAKVVNYL